MLSGGCAIGASREKRPFFNGWRHPGSQKKLLSEVTEHRSDVRNTLGQVHLEARHENVIASIEEMSSRSFLFHASPGKLAQGAEEM